MAGNLRVYQLAVPRENEYSPEAAASLFSSMAHLSRPSVLRKWLFNEELVRVSLETMVVDQKVHFFGVVNEELGDYWESQFQAAYPLGVFAGQDDYLNAWKDVELKIGQMVQTKQYYYPFKTYKEFSDVDPMALVLGVMSKARTRDIMCFQMVMTGAGEGWRKGAQRLVMGGVKQSDGTSVDIPGKSLVADKIVENSFWTSIRLAANSNEALNKMASAFGSLKRGDGNGLKLKKPWVWGASKARDGFFERTLHGAPSTQVLSVSELATLWHMPNNAVKLQNLTWAKNLDTEAPDNLPVHQFMNDDDRSGANFFARTNFRGEEMVFGIKREDRTRHMYVIGKSGVGKSTLLENMAIGDMKRGEGLAFLDPHGNSAEHLLNYVPKSRINDVVYFDPADTAHPIGLNILEVVDPGQREFVASAVVSIFAKLYENSWGPRLEYVLRNTLLTLTEVPGTTLLNILDILTNNNYRKLIVGQIKDPVMIKFWEKEFNRWQDRQQTEAVAPITNKVGQFVSSPLIRRIISEKESSISLEDVMNEGKILVVNLSQGRMGEDNAALMGAMMITKIQLAAMRRATDPDKDWKDFYMYVDEFQNFATSSFIKILSEARKYRLGLILANQYVEQIGEEIMAAVKGNAGTLVNFLVGSDDAKRLIGEYGGLFEEKDLVGLGRGEVIVKLAIDGLTSRAFFAKTLPPAASRNQNKEKVIRVSRERWSIKQKKDEVAKFDDTDSDDGGEKALSGRKDAVRVTEDVRVQEAETENYVPKDRRNSDKSRRSYGSRDSGGDNRQSRFSNSNSGNQGNRNSDRSYSQRTNYQNRQDDSRNASDSRDSRDRKPSQSGSYRPANRNQDRRPFYGKDQKGSASSLQSQQTRQSHPANVGNNSSQSQSNSSDSKGADSETSN